MPGPEISTLLALFCFTNILIHLTTFSFHPSSSNNGTIYSPISFQVLGDLERSNLMGTLIYHFVKTQAYIESTNILKRQMTKFVNVFLHSVF